MILPIGGLFGCTDESSGKYGGLDVDLMSPAERTECLSKGGTVYLGGIEPTELCELPTSDAGKSCKREGDCEGYCQSDTRTCSKVHRGSGFYKYLDEDGQPQEVWID
ncbi:MAG: hypothetical protein JNN02_09620 [Tabrizicola sp.]|nr:hypothetical protein [Tabrizicola sp.]